MGNLPVQSHHASALGSIRLSRRASGVVTYSQKGGHQSIADAAGVSLASYVHALYSLALQHGGRRVLMIGCGGGTLATMLARVKRRVTVVDVDRSAVHIARRHFGMPREIDCIVADGAAFLQRTRRRFDVIIVDAFIGEDVPPQFTTAAFADSARRRLAANGLLLINVCLDSRRDLRADRLAATFAAAGWSVRVLDDRRAPERNAVVLAGAVKDLKAPWLLVTPAVEAARVTRELSALAFRRRKRVTR